MRRTLTGGDINFDALSAPYLTNAITLPAVVSTGYNRPHALASRTRACHLESAINHECPSARTVTRGALGALRPCFESSPRTCSAVDDWVHFDSPRGAFGCFHEAHSNASFDICTPDILRKRRSTATASPTQCAEELIKEVRLPTTASKCRPKTTSERITGKRVWVETGLLRGRAILIESCPLLVVFQYLHGPVRAAVVTTTITDTHHMLLEFQQTYPVHLCRGLYLDDICGLAELGVN